MQAVTAKKISLSYILLAASPLHRTITHNQGQQDNVLRGARAVEILDDVYCYNGLREGPTLRIF